MPKQFREIAGIPMLLRSIRPFARHPRVGEIVVAVPAEYVERPPAWLEEIAGECLQLTAGGATRGESVHAALRALRPHLAVVLVHDAARPFVSQETVDAVIDRASHGVSVVPAVPVSDTIKRVEPDGVRVLETVERSALWRAQTPQGFPRSALVAAFDRTEPSSWGEFTDEAALVQTAGFPVEVVPDRDGNLKVTTEDDFAMAAFLAARR